MCLLFVSMLVSTWINVFQFLFPLVKCCLIEGHECICCGMFYVNFYFWHWGFLWLLWVVFNFYSSPCGFLSSYKLSSTFIPSIGGCEVCHIVCCLGMYIIKFLSARNIWVAKVDGESGLLLCMVFESLREHSTPTTQSPINLLRL
jgi:hypothetical protein